MTKPREDLTLDGYVVNAGRLASDPRRWPRQMAEITDLLADELAKGLPASEADMARPLAGRLMARVAREYGGAYLYVPKGDALQRALRDNQLWADYDGTCDGPNGIRALARREGLAELSVYRLIAAQRCLHRTSQTDLFGDDDVLNPG